MPQKVHPSSMSDNYDLSKPSTLRGKACLRSGTAGGDLVGATMDGKSVEWSQRSEFELLLDFLDTDGNGKVSALEVADFVDSLLGTQDHKRPKGSIVFEAVLTAALRHSSTDTDGISATDKSIRPPPPPPPVIPSPPPPPPGLKTDSGKWTSSRSEVEDASTIAPAPKHRPSQSQLQQLESATTGKLESIFGEVSIKELHHYGSTRFLTMEAVRKCFADLLADTDLWILLSRNCSVMTTTLFRQLLMYSADRLERKFSMMVFLKTYAAFNALPLWLPFRMLWCTRKNGTLFLVYLHQLTKLQNQLGPWISSRLPLHGTLVVLTMIQFIATYVPLVAFVAAHGIRAAFSAKSIVHFMHANPMPDQVSLFSSILPFAVLQFLTSSAALKLSCRDFMSLKEQCKAIFMLGDVASEFEGYQGLTVRQVMDNIKTKVELSMAKSSYRRLNALMPLIFSLSLETFRRLVRLFLVKNLVPREFLGKVLAPFEVYALVYNIWFAYSESADCAAYLYKLRKMSSIFKTLLSKEEALSQSLPWLNNHSPRNLLLWSRLRRYYQSPNCLELRWIEMHVSLVVLAAIAVTIVLIVTFVQKTLLRFTPENADLQLFVVWVIPPFIYLLSAVVLDVIMSASTGTEYHDAIMTLSAEAVFIADRLNCAEEIVHRYGDDDDEEGENGSGGCAAADSDEERLPSLLAGGGPMMRTTSTGAGSRKPASAVARQPPSETGLVRRLTGSTSGTGIGDERNSGSDPSGGGGGGGGGGGRRSSSTNNDRRGSGSLEGISGGGDGGGGGWLPAAHYRLSARERSRLRQCQQVIKSLVTYIQFNAEFITIFGVPIDTHLRNTLFSVSVTLVGAGISAFLAIVVKRN
ncbi:hypothetical protein VaNZ11_010150 [Volvox africanus]|uniref:EF-hand domain-containing protein n=1 Tax=Volvox africanus TaxID=51714 RepID=A0ABQ5SAJ4_9CHLO|nr:hypothetical protein VaNZ11_010150 [Volvox africanus]